MRSAGSAFTGLQPIGRGHIMWLKGRQAGKESTSRSQRQSLPPPLLQQNSPRDCIQMNEGAHPGRLFPPGLSKQELRGLPWVPPSCATETGAAVSRAAQQTSFPFIHTQRCVPRSPSLLWKTIDVGGDDCCCRTVP